MTNPLNPYIEFIAVLVDNQKKPQKIQELVDCLIINQLLAKIKQFPLPVIQINPSTFAHIFSNLKETYKQIELFWANFLERPLECSQIDLVDIAHHGNQRQMQKIIDLFIQTVVQSSEKQYFVNKILETSPETQKYFMNIVQKTLNQYKTLSPRKQREQRLYDRMMELDHENENLQIVIHELCDEKFELENKYQQLCDRIKEKNIQIERLNDEFVGFETPQRRRNYTMDLIDKNSEYIERLKSKMSQMTKDHAKELQNYSQQIENLRVKIKSMEDLKCKLELYQAKIEASQEALATFEQLTAKYNELNQKTLQKDNTIDEYIGKLDNTTTIISRLEEQIIEKESQIEKMNQKIDDLKYIAAKYTGDDNNISLSPMSLRKTLSEHCPDVQNTQTEMLLQTNKKLRQELERASLTIKQRQTDLSKIRKQYENAKNFEFQNRKLLAIIQTNNQRHQDEKYLLLGALYEIRTRYQNQVNPKQKRKKQISGMFVQKNQKNAQRINLKRGLRVMQVRNYEQS